MKTTHLVMLLPALALAACSGGSSHKDTGVTHDTALHDSGPDGPAGDGARDQRVGDQFIWPDQGSDAVSDAPSALSTTIPKIKDGTVPQATLVLLPDVVVTAVDGYGPYTGDVVVQEISGGARSGILLYKPTRADGGVIADLKPGDHVKVVGEVKHYAPTGGWNDVKHPTKTAVKELVNGSLTLISAGAAPMPVVVGVADVLTDPTAENWEHVLVQVKDVKVLTAVNSYGEFSVTGGLPVDDELHAHTPTVGDCLTITGVMYYFYGYKLYPRAASDVQPSTGCAGAPTLAISDIQDVTSVNHPAVNTQVKISGVITAVDAAKDGSGSYSGFFVQEPAGGPYSGIYVYHKWDDTAAVKPVYGELVEVTGTYTEYSGVSELINVTWISQGAGTVPAPAVVAAADVANGGSVAEVFEGVLIQVPNIEVLSVVQDTAGKNVAFVDKLSGLYVDGMLHDFLNPTPPAVGTTYSKIVGPLHYAFNAFRIAPRSGADLVP